MKLITIICLLATLAVCNAQLVAVNVALGQFTWQSSNWISRDGLTTPSGLAVDGNATQFQTNTWTPSAVAAYKCSSTLNDEYAWWAVDLGSVMNVKSVTIYPRAVDTANIANVVVGVSNLSPDNRAPLFGSYPVCGQLQGAPTSANPFTFTCTPEIVGRYVIAQLPGRNVLELCEVTVCASPADIKSCSV